MNDLCIERDRQIDPDSLDVEWVEQSNLYYKYSEALNKANEYRNDLKIDVEEQEKEVDRIKAELELEIRNDPSAFDLDKATDNSVKAAVLLQPKYQESLKKLFALKRELNTSQNDVNKCFTDVNTISEKKTALSNLGGLLAQQYFSTPSVPRNLNIEYKRKKEIMQSQSKEKIKKRMRRNQE